MKKKYILLDVVNEFEDLNFVSLQSLVKMKNKVEILYIIFKLYKRNLQTICEKHLTLYHHVDPVTLWFVNTTGSP